MEIIKASTAGFCFGVENAVKKAFDIFDDSEKTSFVFSYGSLIHNADVVKRLADKGLEVIDSVQSLYMRTGNHPELATVIIRAHGVPKNIYAALSASGAKVIDATCPFVRKIHQLVAKEYEKGNKIIIFGDASHPEVIGINGWCDNSAVVFSEAESCKRYINEQKVLFPDVIFCIFAQTTFSKKRFNEVSDFFKKSFDKVLIFDTICNATSMRQQETVRIASQVDVMIVVGSRDSSNTCKLYDLSKEICPNVYLIENATELDVSKYIYFFRAGVTAGASTPDWIIEEVIGIMSEINSNESNVEEVKDIAQGDCVAEEIESVAAPAAQDEVVKAETVSEGDSFETMLDKALTTITSGEIVKGAINKIDSKGVYVDLGFKFEGFIDIEEFSEVPGYVDGSIKIGDEVEAMVVKVSDKDGEAILSKRRVDNKKNMKLLEDSFESKTPVIVKVTEVVKGGLVAFLGSVRVFIPASQVAERFVKDLTVFVGKTMEVVITAYEKGNKGHIRIIGSHRIIVVEAKAKKEEAFWGQMEVGKVCKGIVKSFTPFGAFVDIGGYDGLIHITELSWKRVTNPADVLSIGQEVEVKVLAFERDKERISLGYRKPEDNPWFDAENLYQVGDILEVTVVRFVAFGCFVNIAPGVDGLVHISQISNRRITNASDCLKVGQKVMAKIIDTNIPEKKINLSIRDVQPYDPEISPEELAAQAASGDEGEKKDRPRRRRNDRNEGGENRKPEGERQPRSDRANSEERGEKHPRKERTDRKPKANPDETKADQEFSMGTSISDILASKFQSVPELDVQDDQKDDSDK